MQGAGPDEAIVGDPRAEFGDVVDMPDQVRMARVVEFLHGQAVRHAMVHQHVDFVALSGVGVGVAAHQARRWIGGIVGTLEIIGIGQHILQQRVEPGCQLGRRCVLLLEFLDEVAGHEQGHLVVERLQALQPFLAPTHGIAQDLLQLRLQCGHGGFNAFALLDRQAGKILRRHDRAVPDRCEGKPGRGAQ